MYKRYPAGVIVGSPYLQHRVATLLVQHGRRQPTRIKPFFEVLSFSALFGTGCCCQLVCFEFGVLHFRLPLYTRNGQIGEHVLLLWFLALALAGCCCQLVCFERCASFPFAYTRNGQIGEHVRRTENKQKYFAPPPRARGSTWGLFLQVC